MNKVACPCCGYATLELQAAWEICPVCFWEDDGQDGDEADAYWGGANPSSLTAARRAFLTTGASDPRRRAHVRPPAADEPRLRWFVLKDGEVVEEPAKRE